MRGCTEVKRHRVAPLQVALPGGDVVGPRRDRWNTDQWPRVINREHANALQIVDLNVDERGFAVAQMWNEQRPHTQQYGFDASATGSVAGISVDQQQRI